MLITVRSGGIDEAVSGTDRVFDAPLALGQIGYLENPNPSIGISIPLFNTICCMAELLNMFSYISARS